MSRYFFVFLFLSGCLCSKEESSAVQETPEQKLISRGRVVYQSNCIACHNPNPKMNGSQGPIVYGSSKELLQARVVHGNYPAGYTPKRTTSLMPPLPHLSNDIDALSAFLNSEM